MSSETITNIPLIFDEKIAKSIVMELDGWQLIHKEKNDSSKIEPFLDLENPEALEKLRANKKINYYEVKYFYESSVKEALIETNRYNIDDLDEVLSDLFLNGIIKLTASNIWSKNNTQTNDNNEETISFDAHSAKLYSKGMKIIKKFTLSTLVGLTSP